MCLEHSGADQGSNSSVTFSFLPYRVEDSELNEGHMEEVKKCQEKLILEVIRATLENWRMSRKLLTPACWQLEDVGGYFVHLLSVEAHTSEIFGGWYENLNLLSEGILRILSIFIPLRSLLQLHASAVNSSIIWLCDGETKHLSSFECQNLISQRGMKLEVVWRRMYAGFVLSNHTPAHRLTEEQQSQGDPTHCPWGWHQEESNPEICTCQLDTDGETYSPRVINHDKLSLFGFDGTLSQATPAGCHQLLW